jgi:Protein of unknown function (DUF3551)
MLVMEIIRVGDGGAEQPPCGRCLAGHREAAMKIIIWCAAVATLCALPGGAAAQGAFCAMDSHGYSNCGFHTLAQCRESLAGMGGTCTPNPAARATGEQPQTPAKKRSRRDR